MDAKEYLRNIGKKGGDKTKSRHGKDYYKKLSALGVIARRKKKNPQTKIF